STLAFVGKRYTRYFSPRFCREEIYRVYFAPLPSWREIPGIFRPAAVLEKYTGYISSRRRLGEIYRVFFVVPYSGGIKNRNLFTFPAQI
ncbi:MAG: hypothetical protein LBN29_06975, partial [Mediterranea sp.]|nr:hypothetical protein [Mediterranea sp.]